MRTCRLPGCGRRTTTYGVYCTSCNATNRRHGDPQQRGITKADLKYYLEITRARIEKNGDNPAWKQLEGNWNAAVRDAQAYIRSYQSGRPVHSVYRRACEDLVRVAEDVEPMKVIETAIAMFVMYDQEPRKFRSDEAFWFQLARRVRGLTERNIGASWNHETQKMKLYYRDVPPNVTRCFAEMVKESVGIGGIYVAKLEGQEAEAKQKKKNDLHESLRALA